jgi:hypothetical protein
MPVGRTLLGIAEQQHHPTDALVGILQNSNVTMTMSVASSAAQQQVWWNPELQCSSPTTLPCARHNSNIQDISNSCPKCRTAPAVSATLLMPLQAISLNETFIVQFIMCQNQPAALQACTAALCNGKDEIRTAFCTQ